MKNIEKINEVLKDNGAGLPPDPELAPRAKRRRFRAGYKLQILKEADACTEPGEIGALLRREGLYSSHLTEWRRQRDAGALQALGDRRGRKAKSRLEKENERLRRETEQLRDRLAQAERIIEVQKKVSELLGIAPAPMSEDR